MNFYLSYFILLFKSVMFGQEVTVGPQLETNFCSIPS